MWITIFIQPIFNLLILIYNLIGDMGLAIILLTILIQLLLVPLYNRQLKSQQAMKDLQPKLKKVQEKHAKDKQKQSQAMMELYKSEGVNPLSGCLPLLIQFPIFIAVYYVFRSYLTEDSFQLLYSFVSRPETLNTGFLGWCDLAQPDKIILPILAGVTTYFQIQSMPQPDLAPRGDDKKGKDQGFGAQLTKVFSSQMKGFMPIMSFVIVMQMPAAIGVYWITRNIFTIIQQKMLLKDHDKGSSKDVKVKVKKA